MSTLSVGDVISRINSEYDVRISPRIVTALFYYGCLRSDICPVVNGQRAIPQSYLQEIIRELKSRGRLPQATQKFVS